MRPLVAAACAAAAIPSMIIAVAAPAAAVPNATPSRAVAHVPSRANLPTERSLLARAPRGVGDLYGLNDVTHHVVRFDLRHGRWQTSLIGSGWVHPVALSVTRTGVAWVVDAGTGKLVRVGAGGARRTIRTMTDPDGVILTTDRKGAAYLNDGTTIYKVSKSGRTITVLGTVHPAAGGIVGLGPDNAGHVVAVYQGDYRNNDGDASDVDAASFATSAPGTPTIRHLDAFSDGGYVYDVTVGPTGAIVLHDNLGGGSGYVNTLWYAPGATTSRDPETKLSDTVYAFDTRGLLYLMENRDKCIGPDPSCQSDNAVDQVIVYPAAGGAYATIPTSNLQLPGSITADVRGRVWASGGGMLQTIPPAGGPAYRVLQGAFFAIQAPPGR